MPERQVFLPRKDVLSLEELHELALGFIIGLSLGLLGGGGSILTVPALVYLVGQSPQAAVTTSLAIVGANSIVGAFIYRKAQPGQHRDQGIRPL